MKNNNDIRNSLFANYPELVSVEDVTKMLNIGRLLVYKMIDNKQITGVKIGKHYRIVKQSIIDYILGE